MSVGIYDRRFSLIILYAIVLHFSWMFLSIYDLTALGSTALAAIVALPFVGNNAGYVCGAAGFIALCGLFFDKAVWRLSAFIPQQLLLLISAGGAVSSIASGMYADGTIRSRAFIAVDQVPAILTALCHTMAMVRATEENGNA